MASTKVTGQQLSDCDVCVKILKTIQCVDDYSLFNTFDGRN